MFFWHLHAHQSHLTQQHVWDLIITSPCMWKRGSDVTAARVWYIHPSCTCTRPPPPPLLTLIMRAMSLQSSTLAARMEKSMTGRGDEEWGGVHGVRVRRRTGAQRRQWRGGRGVVTPVLETPLIYRSVLFKVRDCDWLLGEGGARTFYSSLFHLRLYFFNLNIFPKWPEWEWVSQGNFHSYSNFQTNQMSFKVITNFIYIASYTLIKMS